MFKKLLVCVLLLSGSSVVQGQHVISTVAGGGPPNNSPALQVSIGLPSSVYKDSAGNLYIASETLHAIFKVDGNGRLTTVAGIGGGPGFGGDGGPATVSHLSAPRGVFVNQSGDIYISDSGNNRIRKVVASTGIIQTIVGNGTAGFTGDGGPATSAELNFPAGLYVDGAGNIFIMDSGNNRVRKVTAATGIIQTVAGNGTAGFSGDGGPAVNAELNLQTCALSCGVSVDTAGNIFIADSVNNRIRKVLAATGNIVTFAGNGTAGYSGDGGPATSAELDLPGGLFVDAQGNLFIADTLNAAVRKVVAATGNIQTVPSTTILAPLDVFVDTSGHLFVANLLSSSSSILGFGEIVEVVAGSPDSTVAGNGTFGFSGDGGPATSAQLLFPAGVVVDSKGNIFFADFGNSRVREVLAANGTIQTVAGNGTLGSSGDNGPATSAQIAGPAGVFVDAAGNLFVSDYDFDLIRRVDATTGVITTVAGSGTTGFSGDGGPATSAELSGPAGLYVDGAGNIFIADSGNCRIREVVAATNIIQTVAGNGTCAFGGDGGPATSAELNIPLSVFVNAAGNIYIGDTTNLRIREVLAATKIIQTVAGTGTAGFSGDNGPAAAAQISAPVGVFVDRTGNLFFWDAGNARIREVIAATGNIQTVVGNGTFGFSGDGGPAINAEISSFTLFAGVWGDENSNLYFSDSGNARIRKVTGLIAGPPANISATSGTPQSAAISTAFSPLAATVTDASGNAIGGVTVTFTAPTAGASGTFANEVNTAVTNAAGVATSAVFTANGTRGSYTVTATTPGVTGSAAFDLTNASSLAITTTTLPPATVGTAYSATLQATGGTPPYTWSISVGALPAGLILDASTGAITGTPTSGGTSTFTVKVSDSETPVASQSAGLSITIGTGNPSTLIVLPQPTTVGYGTSLCFYAQDANGNSIAVKWSVSPLTGAGTITSDAVNCPPGPQPGALPGALYHAPPSPPSGSTAQNVAVTALPPSGSCPNSTTNCSAKFTLSGGNGLTACCALPLQLTASAGSPSNQTGAQLAGVPTSSNVPFSLSCAGLPVGAGCIFTAPHTTNVIQSISGSAPKAFCSVFTTGPGTTTGLINRFPPNHPRSPNPPFYAEAMLGLGVLALLLTAWRPNSTSNSRRLALATVALICISVGMLGACNGFSKANVAPPTAQATPAGTYQLQILATPPPGSGFVQNQLIVPLTVN